MRCLLDTHTLIWLASDPSLLGERGRRIIEEEARSVHVSAVTAWELALLAKRGKVALPVSAGKFYRTALHQHGIDEIAIMGEDALAAVALPDLHQDPFDRMLVAVAQREGLVLISRDSLVARYPGVQVIW